MTTACDWKLLPVTASVKAEEPAETVVGETLATMGAGARDDPPPEPPEEQPASSVRVARELARRQRETRRRAGSEVRRVVIKEGLMFRGTLQRATAIPK